MAGSDFLSQKLSVQCDSLAGEINKTYQHLPWALKNEAVARLKRTIMALSKEVLKAQESDGPVPTQKHLKEAVSLVHECAPLMNLCLRKALLSPDLHNRWIKRLNAIDIQLEEWLTAC